MVSVQEIFSNSRVSGSVVFAITMFLLLIYENETSPEILGQLLIINSIIAIAVLSVDPIRLFCQKYLSTNLILNFQGTNHEFEEEHVIRGVQSPLFNAKINPLISKIYVIFGLLFVLINIAIYPVRINLFNYKTQPLTDVLKLSDNSLSRLSFVTDYSLDHIIISFIIVIVILLWIDFEIYLSKLKCFKNRKLNKNADPKAHCLEFDESSEVVILSNENGFTEATKDDMSPDDETKAVEEKLAVQSATDDKSENNEEKEKEEEDNNRSNHSQIRDRLITIILLTLFFLLIIIVDISTDLDYYYTLLFFAIIGIIGYLGSQVWSEGREYTSFLHKTIIFENYRSISPMGLLWLDEASRYKITIIETFNARKEIIANIENMYKTYDHKTIENAIDNLVVKPVDSMVHSFMDQLLHLALIKNYSDTSMDASLKSTINKINQLIIFTQINFIITEDPAQLIRQHHRNNELYNTLNPILKNFKQAIREFYKQTIYVNGKRNKTLFIQIDEILSYGVGSSKHVETNYHNMISKIVKLANDKLFTNHKNQLKEFQEYHKIA